MELQRVGTSLKWLTVCPAMQGIRVQALGGGWWVTRVPGAAELLSLSTTTRVRALQWRAHLTQLLNLRAATQAWRGRISEYLKNKKCSEGPLVQGVENESRWDLLSRGLFSERCLLSLQAVGASRLPSSGAPGRSGQRCPSFCRCARPGRCGHPGLFPVRLVPAWAPQTGSRCLGTCGAGPC